MYLLGALRQRVLYGPRLVFMPFSTSVARRTVSQRMQLDTQPQPTETVQKPFSALSSLVHPNTLKAITETPYKHVHMSPVQEKVLDMLPELVDSDQGKDLLVRAKTGTGKTLAFLVPAIERRLKMLDQQATEVINTDGLGETARARLVDRLAREKMGVLVISPTRELATQIAVSASNLTMHHSERGRGMGVQLFVGGENRGRQMREWLAGRKDIVVGTPGRLRDLLENWDWEPRGGGGATAGGGLKEVFGESGQCVVVLDEADTLLDMGFRSDVDAITAYLKKGNEAQAKQTWMFSATVGKGIEGIVREVMRKGMWEYVDCVGHTDEKDVHAHVRQVHTVVGDEGGLGSFVHLLRLIVHDQLGVMKRNREGENGMRSKMIVFFSATRMTRIFGKLLTAIAERGLIFPKKTRIYEMHSKKEMNQRVAISKEFRERTVREDEAVVMVTSDVSARGVDYPGVGRVVQMGVPRSRESYVHRVGRTGRGDVMEGRGDLVLAPWEMGFLKVLGDVGMEPVTVEGLKAEIEGLAGELDGQDVALTKQVARIEDYAKSMASATGQSAGRWSVVGEEEYAAAWASMAGFYIGSWSGLGLGGLNDVIEGSGRWIEMLGGLEKESLSIESLPRAVLDQVKRDSQRSSGRQRGGKERAWGSRGNSQAGGWGNGGRNESRSGGWGGSRNEEGSSRGGGWGGRNEEGNSRPDRYGGRRTDEGKSRGWSGGRNEEGQSRGWSGSRNEGGQSRGWSERRNEDGQSRGYGSGRSREERFGGSLDGQQEERVPRTGKNRPQASWMGRGSINKKRMSEGR